MPLIINEKNKLEFQQDSPSNNKKGINAPIRDFAINRSNPKPGYRNDPGVKSLVNPSTGGKGFERDIYTLPYETLQQQYFSPVANLGILRDYSQSAAKRYPIYYRLLQYFSNMYLWRYTFVPRIIKPDQVEKGKEVYQEIYNTMAEVVDGINIETIFPELITRIFTEGGVYLYSSKNNSSKTITTTIMPSKYCRPVAYTQYGTIAYQFDCKYFDDLGLNNEELEQAFGLYPKELKQAYDAYKADNKLQFALLNPKFAQAIMMNDTGFPVMLGMLKNLKQYDRYQELELEKNENDLIKIIAHELPVYEDKLVLEIPEAKALHDNIANSIVNKNVRLMTSFGKFSVHSIAADRSVENKTLDNANKLIYDNGGFNNEVFAGANTESIRASLNRDTSLVMGLINKLVLFYNLAINNLYNFKAYQCDINILPLTIYNYKDMITTYKDGATLGVSKLEYVVAAGTKQVNIAGKIAVEDFLGLDQLKPLNTSYTQGDSVEKEKEDKEDSKPEDTDETADEDDKKNKDEKPIKEEEVKEDDE